MQDTIINSLSTAEEVKRRILESMTRKRMLTGYSSCSCGVAFHQGIVLDPFAGWGASVPAAKDLGLVIDAFDIDQDLHARYDFLNAYTPNKISDYFQDSESFQEVSDSK